MVKKIQICQVDRQLIITRDGSHTIHLTGQDITYHSRHGAIQEAKHVCIESGLKRLGLSKGDIVRILEMGFGAGLNALLTQIESASAGLHVHYTALEKFPLEEKEWQQLNYCSELKRPDLQPFFVSMHSCGQETDSRLSDFFTLLKIGAGPMDFIPDNHFDLIYYDAFAPSTQPELWSSEIFERLYSFTNPGGILVTYCAKGDVRRAMRSGGWLVERIPGPKWKRQMLRALKPAVIQTKS